MGKNKDTVKPKSSRGPSIDNDQIGENSSGYGKQDDAYKKSKSK